jgi:hypothetical protein
MSKSAAAMSSNNRPADLNEIIIPIYPTAPCSLLTVLGQAPRTN